VSESGSAFIRKHVLETLLDNEKEINQPGKREHSWITSANYEMKLKPGSLQRMDERDCHVLTITPRHKATNMIEGTIWVDAKDGEIVRIEGVSSQSPSVLTGPAHVMRKYASLHGYAMATQARAVSDSFLLGRTVIPHRLQRLPDRGSPRAVSGAQVTLFSLPKPSFLTPILRGNSAGCALNVPSWSIG
jgi:hypothetical protein